MSAERGMSGSDRYAVGSAPLRERVEHALRPHASRTLLALTIGCIVALAVLKAGGTHSSTLSAALGGVLAVSFIALALVDFRASVAVALFELVLGGAGGRWIDYGGGLTGRIFLDAVVTLRAAGMTISDWRRGGRAVLGRYGAHALAIAILIPAIWIPLGLANGNLRGNVVSDGDGFFFFAFVLVVVTLVRRGEGAWFRRMFFAACAANAAMYFVLIVVSTSGAVSLETVREWLSVRLAMGGVIGHMPNGDYRLFTGGSLFLQVGLVLTAQRLLARPRAVWLWLLAGVICVSLIATYTRGLWLGAFVGVALVVALGVRSVRQLGFAVGIPSVIAGLALVVTPLAGFSLYDYLSARTASTFTATHTRYRALLQDPSFETASSAWAVNNVAPRSLHVTRTAATARAGARSLELANPVGHADDYVFQNLAVKPKTEYSVGVWLNARTFAEPAAAERGLLVWDAQDGLLYTVPLTSRSSGWRRLSLRFTTKAKASEIQIRLYAPRGRVFWDGVRVAAGGHRQVSPQAAGGPLQVASIPVSQASASMQLATSGGGGGGKTDTAGEASNSYRIAEAKALLHYIRSRPIYGYGFGSVASNFATGYSYELSYLDLLFKTGILGLLLFLSFPVRLVVDALRVRLRHAPGTAEDGRAADAGVVVGVIVSILLVGATNPYLFAAFGLVSILAMVAWLDEGRRAGPV